MSTRESKEYLRRLKGRLILVFCAAAAVSIGGGAIYHRHYQAALLAAAGDLLSSIEQFKVAQISYWRTERLEDSLVLADSLIFSSYVERFAENPGNKELAGVIKERLRNYLKYKKFTDAFIAGADGKIHISARPAAEPLCPEARAAISRVRATGRPALGQLNLPAGKRGVHLDLAAPASKTKKGGKLFLVLSIDPEDYLYPLIQAWPTNSRTGETLIIRKEGDSALYLNRLRHKQTAPLTMRLPLSAAALPAARVLKGETGVFRGTDYRGEPVLAAAAIVPGTDWGFVAKMDLDEVLADSAVVSALLLLVVALMLATAGGGTFLLFRLQAAAYTKAIDAAEAEAEKNRVNYELLVEKASDLVLVWDQAARGLLSVNRKACEAYGRAQSELLKLKPEELMPRESLAAFNELFTAPAGSGLVYETAGVKKDGTEFPIGASVSIIEQGGKKLVYFIGQDITERRRAEEALRGIEWMLTKSVRPKPFRKQESPQAYGDVTGLNTRRLILDSLGEKLLSDIADDYLGLLDTCAAIYEKNGDYAFGVFASDWCRFLDEAGRSLCGTPDNKAALASGRWVCHESCWNEASKVSIETGRPADIECKGGIHIYAAPIRAGAEIIGSINFGYGDPPRDPQKIKELSSLYGVKEEKLLEMAGSYQTRPFYIIAIAKRRLEVSATLIGEIVERKRAEAEVRGLNATLERRVAERTLELENSNRELEAFSYSVSHDLRAPLRHAGGYVNLLACRCRGALPEKGLHYLDAIVDSVRQMGVLIEDLLLFSRTGRAGLRRAAADMDAVFREALEPLRQENAGRAVDWVVGKFPEVRCDAAMLKLVWTNLLGNALKFTRRKERARIEAGWREEGREQVFFVRDNGAGFDMRYAKNLFGVFQRLHAAAEFEGTGIGLANVRRIILRHGGRTWAEAEPEKGAVFYFTLPKNIQGVSDGVKNIAAGGRQPEGRGTDAGGAEGFQPRQPAGSGE